MKPTKNTLNKFYERAKILNPDDLNDIMKWCYYSIKAGLKVTERRLKNFGVSEENLKLFQNKNILSLMKDGKTYFFNAYEYCKDQAEKFNWDKQLEKREEIGFQKLINGDFEVED